MKDWDFLFFFFSTDLYHCNEPERTRGRAFAGRCDNVHVRSSRYGKIEQRAERGREEGRVLFPLSISLPPISH